MAKKDKEETALVKDDKPKALANLPDYGDLYGEGFQHQDSSDIIMPMIVQLQALSPMVTDERTDRHGRKAEPGLFYNTVENELYERLLIVPAVSMTKYCKWVPRDSGGGFRGHLEPGSPEVEQAIKESKEFGKYMIGDLELVETKYLYLVRCEGEEAIGPAVLPMTSSKIKPFKLWNSRLAQCMLDTPDGRKRPAPMFAHFTELTSFGDKNKKGQPFKNIKFTPAVDGNVKASLLAPDDERFIAAWETMKFVSEGRAKVNFEAEKMGGAEGAGGEARGEGVSHF